MILQEEGHFVQDITVMTQAPNGKLGIGVVINGELEQRLTINKTINRPVYWSGYIVVPKLIEFWNQKPHRLHDRVEYRKKRMGFYNQLDKIKKN